MANLFSTRMWLGSMVPMVRAGGGFSKGLNGFLGDLSSDEGGGFGLLAREGEKRS